MENTNSNPRSSARIARPRRFSRPKTRKELFIEFQKAAEKMGLDNSKENIELSVLEVLAKRQYDSKRCILSHAEVRRLINAKRLPRFAQVRENQGPYDALILVELGDHHYKLVENGFADHVLAANEEKARTKRETEVKRRQRNAAARELHRLYMANKLPEGCSVEYESRAQVRINTPLAIFVLHATKQPKRGLGSKKPAQLAEVLLFPCNTEEIDAGWEATG
jgi:hypothetical protein